MRDFTYHNPTKIHFGKDSLASLGQEVAALGHHALLVYGGGSIRVTGLYDKIADQLFEAGIEFHEHVGIQPNPRLESVVAGIEKARKHCVDVVIAAGGGSVMDAAKAIAIGVPYDGDVWDLVVGRAHSDRALPVVCIPTMAATGSEMDSTAVITNERLRLKECLFSPAIQPRVSFLDPTLTYTVSSWQTACGCADMLSHVLEVYFCPDECLTFLDREMEGIMRTIMRYAPVALKDPQDYEARSNLMWAATWAINGFIESDKAHAWSCHGMGAPLSAYYDMTHGASLAVLTPSWMRYCLDESTVDKYYEFGVEVFGIDDELPEMEVAERAIGYVEKFLFEVLGLPSSLTAMGVEEDMLEVMAASAYGDEPVPAFKPLTRTDVVNIYRMCL